MITRDPDITRLLDRLEKRELDLALPRDQRPAHGDGADHGGGVEAAGAMDEPVREGHRRQLGHLGRERLRGADWTFCGPRGWKRLDFLA